MTIYDLKPKFQNLLRPLVKNLFAIGITPNQITIFTCVFSMIFALTIYQNVNSKIILNIVPLFFFMRMALNAIDGMLAKEFKMTSKLGALLNEITDVISDFCLYLAFISHSNITPSFLVIFSFIAILTEFAGVAALQVGPSRRFDGPMGKSDRAFFISLISLLLANTNLNSETYTYLLVFAIILSIFTVLNRLRRALDFNSVRK